MEVVQENGLGKFAPSAGVCALIEYWHFSK
jgi:hypothetical protein